MSFDPSDVTGKWDYGQLPKNIRFGRDCWFERKDSFGRYRSELPVGLSFGHRVRVYTWTAFNIEPKGAVEIGDDCVLVGAVFMCAQSVRIGQRVLISYHVTIADSDFHPLNPDQRRRDAIANAPNGDRRDRPELETSPVVIDDDARIGIGAVILKGVHIGVGAHVGAGSVVTADVLPGTKVLGNPARPITRQGLS